MTTAGSNFISGITTTVFASTDVVNKTYVDTNVKPIPSQTGSAGKFLTTTDGTNLSWDYVSNYQEFTSPGISTFNVPSYANLLYIEAVGAGGGGSAGQTLNSGIGGVVWTLRTSGNTNTINNIIYVNNNYFGAINSGIIISSTDVITWTLRTTGTPSSYYIIYGNAYLFYGASGSLSSSTDSITWTLRTSGTIQDFRGATFGNNLYVLGGVSGVLNTSTDTINWSLRTSGTTTFQELFFANSTYVGGTNTAAIITSTNAIQWVLRTSGFGTVGFVEAFTFGNNTYVAGGSVSGNSILSTSTDAIVWTLRTSGFGATTINDLDFVNNTYIAACSSGILGTSTNAIVWSLRTSGTTNTLNSIKFGNNTYVTAGASGTLITSYSQASGQGGASGSYTSWYVPKSIVTSNITVNPGVGGTGATTDAATGSAGAGTTVSWTGPGGTYTVTASGGSATTPGAAQLVTQSSYFYTTAGLSGAPPTPLGNGISATTQTNQFQPTGGGSGGTNYVENWSWTLRTAGFDVNNIGDVILVDNTYIAVSGTNLNVSTDAINWTLRTTGFGSNSVGSLAYGNNVYLAGGSSGRLNTSTDTIHWIARTAVRTNASNNIGDIIFTNNIYVLGAGNGILNTSTDAIIWTLRTSSFSSTIFALIFGNNTYVAAGQNGNLNTSTDTITWELRTSGFGGDDINDILFVNDTYVAGGYSARLNTSTDAITWTLRTSSFGFLVDIAALTFANNLYYAAGEQGRLNTSTNAITWTYRTSNTTQTINALVYSPLNNDIVYGANAGALANLYLGNPGGSGGIINAYGILRGGSGGKATGGNGESATAISGLPYGYGGGGGSSRAESSYWTLRTSGTTSNLNSISGVSFFDDIGGYTYYGLMAAGDSGVLSTSTDGFNWTLRTSSFGVTAIRASLLTYSSGEKSLIVGDGGNLRTSTNGIQWSSYSSGTANALYAIGPGQGTDDGTWTIGGASGYLASSGFVDLTTWTSRTSGFGSNAIYAINFAAQDPFAGPITRSAAGANGTYAYSTDSIVWTLRTTAFGTSAIRGLGNNGFIAVGDNGKIATTTDSIVWTLRTSGTTSQLNSISSGTNPYVVVGVNGITLISTDGVTWITKLSSTTNNINSLYDGQALGGQTFYAGNSGTTAILKNPFPVDAGNGGNGVRGGGGGGGSTNGTSFGNGGNGGNGYVKITWW